MEKIISEDDYSSDEDLLAQSQIISSKMMQESPIRSLSPLSPIRPQSNYSNQFQSEYFPSEITDVPVSLSETIISKESNIQLIIR